MQRFFSRRAAAVLALAALAACDAPISAPPAAEPQDELARQVEALGFRGDMVQDFGAYVLVEGDIHITKDELRRAAPRSADPLGPRLQYRTTSLVSQANVSDIVVDVSGLASEPDWQTAAREALTHWSGIASSNVRMVEGSPADITVATTCTASNVAAYASFPAGGNAGPTIHVNTCFGYATSYAQKVHNMVHELGHSIGFRHSNYAQMGESAGVEGAVHVVGTPTSGNDPGSVMNGGTALNSWAGFSAADLTAVRGIYPLPAPTGLTVTNSGGHPLISWNAAPGATNYTIQLITYNTLNGQYQNRSFSTLGTTTGTSYLTGHTWTGQYSCSSGYVDERIGGERGKWYEYSVRANYPNGSSNPDAARHYAYIAREYCMGFIG